MFGISFIELLMLSALLIPLMLLMIGIISLTVYTIYLLIRDRFLHGIHLRHRKAH